MISYKLLIILSLLMLGCTTNNNPYREGGNINKTTTLNPSCDIQIYTVEDKSLECVICYGSHATIPTCNWEKYNNFQK